MNAIERMMMTAGLAAAVLAGGIPCVQAADTRAFDVLCVKRAAAAFAKQASEYEEASKIGPAEFRFSLVSRPAANSTPPDRESAGARNEGGSFLSLCPKWDLQISLIATDKTGMHRPVIYGVSVELGATVEGVMGRMAMRATHQMFLAPNPNRL